MDNMKYYNDSLAYDFEMFMPHTAEQPRTRDNIVKLPKVNTRARARQRVATRTVSISAFAVMAAAFILAALCGNIFLRLQINEVNSQINEMKTEINTLDSEKTSLEVEFDRRVSYSNIEQEATALGMRKMIKDQVKYIRVNDKNSAKTIDGDIVSETK